MKHDKLNFGCGVRFSQNWTNIDLDSRNEHVQRVNLLRGFPFADDSFQAVYSSHVLEHFPREQGRFLIREAWRVLRKGGIVRIVVPDLQGSCTEYLRILSLPDGPAKKKLYSWTIVELIDQMVRDVPLGEWGKLENHVMASDDDEWKAYVRSRTENTRRQPSRGATIYERLKTITPQKIASKLPYLYLKAVSQLIPPALRGMVFVQTYIGERHRWMYDVYGMRLLLEEVGFSGVQPMKHDESRIPDFNADQLDCNPDGEPYKHNSIYLEGIK
jgi:predicted SAM-dependent methyltransferase